MFVSVGGKEGGGGRAEPQTSFASPGSYFAAASRRVSQQMLKRGEKHQVEAIMKAASADPCGQSELEFSIFSLHAFCLDLLSQFTPF